MTCVTIGQICEHYEKHPDTVIRCLKAAGVKLEKIKGVPGYRPEFRAARNACARQWPHLAPLPANYEAPKGQPEATR